jgi:aryl-alcohol dehydrogenase-like predicted oxidoreductase
MKYTYLGKSDLKVSVIGQGSGQFGAKGWGYGLTYWDDDLIKVIKADIENGITLFDTSETYGNGQAEVLLGNTLREYDRDDFTIITKVAPWNLSYESVLKAANKSLQRLNLKTIDLYLIHYPNPFIPLRSTMRAMEQLVDEGKIRYIGVSNFNRALLVKAQENLRKHEIIANEVEYNVFSKRAEVDLIPYCKSQKIGIIAYSPLAGGILTGKYSTDNLPKDRARAFNFYNRRYFIEKAAPLFSVLESIAKKNNASIAQIALRYIIRDSLYVAIPAALTAEEVKNNAMVPEMHLSEKEVFEIRKASVTVSNPVYFFDHFIIRPISWSKETLKHLVIS